MDWLALSAEEWTAVRLSLKVAAVATLASLPLGIAVALLLARGRFPGKMLLDGLVHLPLVLPPVVTGYALLLLFGRRGPIGAWLEQSFGIVFFLPLDRRGARLRRHGLPADGAGDPPLHRGDRRQAGAGGRHARRLAATRLPDGDPAAGPARVLAGAVLCFAKALGEFGATITFVSKHPGETQTIPAAIYNYTQAPGGDSGALRLSIVAVTIALGALLASELLARRAARTRAGMIRSTAA